MTLNPNLKPNLYEISWNCKIQKLCLGQLMNTTLLISNLRQMRTYATAITACSVGKERSYQTCKSKITMWWCSVTLDWTILLTTTDLNGIPSPKVTKSDFYIGFSVQTVFGTQDRFRCRKSFWILSNQLLAGIFSLKKLLDTLLFDWKNARVNRNQSNSHYSG